MRKLLFTAAASIAACAPPAAQAQQRPPKLVIMIAVDQLSADLWDEYRPHFTGGLARLAGGTVYRNGFQSHGATETCPGHATMLTGVRPGRSGIVSNGWIDRAAPRSDKAVYCAEDESAPGTSFAGYRVSPAHLRVPTLGDRLKAMTPASRNVAVSGKDRSAVMMSGRQADQRWYWSNGRFVTDLASLPPRSVGLVNTAVGARIAGGLTPLDPPPLCQSKARPFAVQGKADRIVGNGRFARRAGDAAAFRASPQFDASVLALSAALIGELNLGRGNGPDVLAIGLAGTDYVAHTYGSGGQEMCLQLLSLDRDLGDFFAVLDRQGLDYAVALTADHGGLDIPERLQAKGVKDAVWVDPELAPERVGERVARQLGLSGPLLYREAPFGDVFLDPSVPSASRDRVLAAVVEEYRRHPQVHAVFTKAEIARLPMPAGDVAQWTVEQRLRASFDPARSGDLMLVFKPHVQPMFDVKTYVTTHGSPWDYDRRVPILFWRARAAPSDRNESVETVDIMPTLARLLGLSLSPGDVDGRCLTAFAGLAC